MELSKMKIEKFLNKKIAILGLGEENTALVKFLANCGSQITVRDQKNKDEVENYYREIANLPVKFKLGSDYLKNLNDYDIIFRTPGLPYFNQKIQDAKKAGVQISSQTKHFFELCPCPIIGVTGTKGKGTTATLIYEILKKKSKANSKIYIGGNIGNPPINFLNKLNPTDWVILELSSFQIQDLDKSPYIAVILDIKIDHLDYHKDEKEYIEAKLNLVKFQTKKDFAVINADYLTSIEFASSTMAQVYWFSRRKSIDQGAFVDFDGEIILRDNEDYNVTSKDNLQLKGEHNLENITAAVTASHLAGAKIEAIKETVEEFKGLEHRLEFVKEINGVKYYNDSFSTNPDTTIAAIKSFKEPIILLIGGSEKNADYDQLAEIISRSSVKTIINIGLTGQKIISKINSQNIEIFDDIQEMTAAIDMAFKKANTGDIVLLSPASASFDRYENYKQRGLLFKQSVKNL
ncbi:MAG: UDP-N-acetylmuramoylalanine-D-glutamate ligase [Berkelbacteria bacterium GW2011_GWB1_38_5]|uniref:UDP-N-acetylmuramoylalanine--D-glutamate ligase n=2 Tax=Candidatus Berkelbacteria TaxID=1618330 RepID=A0A0G0LJ27_9BACT|nr:MAG: UDP-N-acetylmuramoylalanine-D-glutamate ligase [Berkelbacteria bacterium GW2011_GWB1_38_5]KKQ91047.1 MAG: UDP-N-acetylmuramoylalanine-D-glutamate ligase [Berkelbacteria bacterium GW2011_GWA1_39_10]